VLRGTLLRPALPWFGACLASAALAAGVVVNPQVTFVLAIAVVCIATVTAPAAAWVLFALIGALTFKGLVSLGALPSVMTYIDLPLAWGALFVALLKLRERSPFLRRHLRWLAALGLAVTFAWAFNPSEVLRPLLYLALLGEPFAIVGALIADPPSLRMRLALERALIVLVLIQIPLAALQFATIGSSDHIQGTLYKAGAGAHVISAVIIVGAIWIVSGGIGRRLLGIWRLPVVAALFFIPFLADAKQVIVALPAIVLASSWRVGRLQLLLRGALVAGSLVALFTLAPGGETAQRFIEDSQQGQGGKQAAALFVWQKLEDDPASLAFGKGPAETVSRAAFLTTDLFGVSDSPLAALGLKPAAIAVEAQGTAVAVSRGGTSFNSGVSSTLGVLGDLGIFGLLAYSGLILSLFFRLRIESSPEGIAAAAGFSLFLVLGLVFDWWEQPPFGVLLGVLAGLSLTRMPNSDADKAAVSRASQ
jgi:hypothetical protein